MKKITLSLIAIVFAINFSYAQNTFPSSGNVGVGTTSPAARLQTNYVFTDPAGVSIQGGPSSGTALTIGGSAGDSGASVISVTPNWNTNASPYALDISPTGTANGTDTRLLNISFAGSNKMVVMKSGNVGIGTTSPSAPLDVESAANSSWATQIINNGTTNAHGLYVNIGSGSTGIPFRVDVNGSDMFQISNTGNVGIGTLNPDQKLTVKGTIHSQEVIVDMSVLPDYVFEPTYHLPTLNDVKTYIDQNHHLPEMPSAEQVAKDGLSLGDMNAKLLKKVEELTLYLIEKDKVLNNQQQEINLLKRKMELITKRLK